MSKNGTIDAAKVRSELAGYVSSSDSTLESRTPELKKLRDLLESGQFHVGSPEETEPPIKVKVEGLIERITARRDAIAAAHDEAIKALDDEDARRDNFAAALGEYFAAFGAAFGSGDYKFDPSTGSLSVKDGGPKLPVQPTRPRTEADVAAARTKALKAKAEALAPFNAQLDTLAIAADPAVEISTVRFLPLLQAPVPSDLKY